MHLPELSLASWRPTRDALHGCARILGAAQQALAPPLPHWWHIALAVTAAGLRTAPLDAGGVRFELELDLSAHRLRAATGGGERLELALRGQPPAELAHELLAFLAARGARVELDRAEVADGTARDYDRGAAERCGVALRSVDRVLKRFRSELGGRTSPVHLWPHHFDLAFTWFSGRHVPDADPGDLDSAAEHLGFGFSTGDEGFADPYLYVTAYPFPAGLESEPPPGAGRWTTDAYEGALLPYADAGSEDGLLEYLRSAWRAAAARMA